MSSNLNQSLQAQIHELVNDLATVCENTPERRREMVEYTTDCLATIFEETLESVVPERREDIYPAGNDKADWYEHWSAVAWNKAIDTIKANIRELSK